MERQQIQRWICRDGQGVDLSRSIPEHKVEERRSIYLWNSLSRTHTLRSTLVTVMSSPEIAAERNVESDSSRRRRGTQRACCFLAMAASLSLPRTCLCMLYVFCVLRLWVSMCVVCVCVCEREREREREIE